MYKKAYGIIETLAPLHVGAAAGEESGNLNLIFRDQFTQTGIIPGSSIRGRFRADMRQDKREKSGDYNHWYGQEAGIKDADDKLIETKEALIKFEYASIVWLPVYCPNQPVVWVSCPTLLNRYRRITGIGDSAHKFEPYKYSGSIPKEKLFFNLGFLKLSGEDKELKKYLPDAVTDKRQYPLVVVDDNDMAMIHDMALYRQSRVALEDTQKKAKKGAFFNLEALPEGTVLAFPLAMREVNEGSAVAWDSYRNDADITKSREFYFGGLESIGFGRTKVTVNLFEQTKNEAAKT